MVTKHVIPIDRDEVMEMFLAITRRMERLEHEVAKLRDTQQAEPATPNTEDE